MEFGGFIFGDDETITNIHCKSIRIYIFVHLSRNLLFIFCPVYS